MVSFAFTNSVGQADTNFFKAIPVSGPVANADGSFTTIGIPIRITPGADGHATNYLAQNNYFITNAFLGQGYYIRVPLDSGPTVYPSGQLLISGANTFVTIYNGPGGTNLPTFNQLTNIFSGTPLVSSNLPSLTNGFIRLLDATNVSAQVGNDLTNYANTLSSQLQGQILLGITNAYATNAAGILVAARRAYISTNYDALGAALTMGGQLTNYANVISNQLQSQIVGGSVTAAGVTNIAVYVAGQATNGYSPLVFTNVSQVLYTNRLPALTNGFVRLLDVTNVTAAATNGYSPLVFTNVSQVLYTNRLPALTNGFVDKSITNQAASTNQVLTWLASSNSAYQATLITKVDSQGGTGNNNVLTNLSVPSQFSADAISAYSGPTITISGDLKLDNSINGILDKTGNVLVSPDGFINGNGYALTNSSASNLQAQALGQVTNVFKAATNGYSPLVFTNVNQVLYTNALPALTNALAATNSPILYTPAIIGGTLNTVTNFNGLYYHSGIGSDSYVVGSAASIIMYPGLGGGLVQVNGNFKSTNTITAIGGFVGNAGGTTNGNATNLQSLALGQVTNVVNALSSGGVTVSLTNAIGTNFPNGLLSNRTLFYPTNFDALGGSNFNFTFGSTASNLLSISKVSNTNGFATGLSSTNTALLGNVSFGPAGLSTNIIASTNYLAILNAGSSVATNGALVWIGSLNLYTNWLNGAVLTNNGSAWLLQTNGVTLYSLAGTSPVGSYSAIGGALPAPAAVYTAAISDHMLFLGANSLTNLNAMITNAVGVASNAIYNLFTPTSSSGAIAVVNGLGTNTTLNFSRAAWGVSNTVASDYSAALAGFQNAVTLQSPGYSAIVGGRNNTVAGQENFIGGGVSNTIVNGYGFIGGGRNNYLGFNCPNDVIDGGQYNAIGEASGQIVDSSFISGGFGNLIKSFSSQFSGAAILGGTSNFVYSGYSVASGRNATATNSDTFIWSGGPASITGTNSQATFSGTNGVRINGPLWLNSLSTNGGFYVLSNQFSLWAVTNSMPNYASWIGSSNGVPVRIYNNNGTPVMTLIP